MGRISRYFHKTYTSLKVTVLRFMPAPLFLVLLTVMISFQIEETFGHNNQNVTRLIYAAILGTFAATALEFLIERLALTGKLKWLPKASSVLLALLYYLFVTSPVKTDDVMIVRLLVLCFALLALYIWLPAFKKPEDFPANALVHFKAFFVSALYSLVLTLGLLAIYYAVDLLLINLDDKIPGHIINIMGTFFFPIYYLSLLPRFNSEAPGDMEKREAASAYPKFLEILVSYIALPLITVFTAVLAVYFLKILVTLKWPVGELGPMVLGYSAMGLVLFVLCGKLSNRFAVLYRRLFPPVLIPLVGLQLYSVFIRINAYGITESRYYLVLFGIYAIVCALCLLLTRNLRIGAVALLAACFAILSVLPPADAFTVSRTSQIARVEGILFRNHMLVQGKVTPSANVSNADRSEITSIMNYLDRMGHISKVKWLPADYEEYRDFEKVFGFSLTYGRDQAAESIDWFNANIDQRLPLDVAGYDTMLKAGLYNSGSGTLNSLNFKMDGGDYRLDVVRTADDDITFSVFDPSGAKALEASIKPFLEDLRTKEIYGDKNLLAPGTLTFDLENQALRIKIIFQSINFRMEKDQSIRDISGDTIVLVGKK